MVNFLLYRGITISWYKIKHRCGREQFAAVWYWQGWHSTPAFATIERALLAAEKHIDHQQAARPALEVAY